MQLNVPNHCIRYGAAGLLIALMLLAACAPSSSPTPTVALGPEATATFLVAPAPTAAATATPEATPSPTEEASTFTIETTKNIAYADDEMGGLKLDVHAPSEVGPWPVVVVVHGYGGPGRQYMKPLSEVIASNGAVVYNIEVRFTFPWSGSIENISCAVRFARVTAADYGGDPGRITLVGVSAGANTGAVAALAGDDFEEGCVVTDVAALPDALVVYEGLYDYATTVYTSSLDHTVLKDEDPELWEAINPYSHIGRNPDLQVRLVHGEDVDVAWWDVSSQVSIDFQQALADAGYDVMLTVLEGADHDDLIYAGSDASQEIVQQVLEVASSPSR